MSMESPGRRSRSRRQERSQQLYEARRLPVDTKDNAPEAADSPFAAPAPWRESDYTPNDPAAEAYEDYSAYTPNDPPPGNAPAADERSFGRGAPSVEYAPLGNDAPMADEPSPAGYTPERYQPIADASPSFDDVQADSSQPFVSRPLPSGGGQAEDWSAYYRRPAGEAAEEATGGEDQYAYAPPIKLNIPGYARGDDPWREDDESDLEPEGDFAPGNVYHPREVNWAQTERRKAVQSARERGYQIEEDSEAPVVRRRKKHRLRRMAALLAVVAVVGGAAYAFREQLGGWLGALTGQTPQASAPAAALATPAPARGYDAASPVQITSKTDGAIAKLCGGVAMQPYVVTDTSIMEKSARADGLYDFYLFSASDGRLLAYYEALGERDVSPLPDGGYYIKQPPYLISADGSATIRTANIEQILGEKAVLHPLMNGWAVIANESGTLNNYVNPSGELLSRLWFAKAYPMTGSYSLAYVDTGNLTDTEGRYVLYRVSADGPDKWLEAGDMSGVVASACGAAYMDSGELYWLSKLDEPLLSTDEVHFYVDCDAMVVRDAQSGKYGLYVHGEQHYGYEYDSIQPVQCDIQWGGESYQGANGSATLSYVVNAAYPQPLSHYFLLKKGDVEAYVALSTASACPVILDE